MSCYLPIPPRDWSRVQNFCSLNTNIIINNNNQLNINYKGNILQYKKNSSNLTKNQRYSKIAKNQWTNRNTTWATQNTRGYTNPNNLSLKRNGTFNITLDGTPTLLPITCPKKTDITNNLLPNTGGESKNPETLPPPPPEPSIDFGDAIPINNIPQTQPIVIQDSGTLLCSIQENICSGQIITKETLVDNCFPTTDSDVPGNIELLCWNDALQTWYPRQRYVMTNSDNKWPTNAKLNSAIISKV